jgi:hypothetical protein
VPGAPPITLTDAVKGASAVRTVTPVLIASSLGIADAKARDIGDEVAWPWGDHDATMCGTVPR